ncbi:hypothetical protein BBJ28_00014853 [Nothophytophthora sp. Chile5]|nr:hypothetical protein BBJ28_00014853 [Nothophytophthora sp. Chile5]
MALPCRDSVIDKAILCALLRILPLDPTTCQTLQQLIMLQYVAFGALFFQAAYVSTIAGHGNIILPKPTGDADHEYYFGDPAGTIDMPEIIGTESYSDYSTMADHVDGWFTENGIDTLKQYIDTYGSNISECGWTAKDGTPQPVPSDGYAEHDTLGNSHPGPCEIWCDDVRVFNDSNCLDTFLGESPAKIPIDVSTCEASAEFVFYWMALHSQPWQIYVNCVALDGTAGSGSSVSTSTSTTATTAPAATTATTTTTAPAATTATTTTTAPATTTASASSPTTAPAATTATPTATSAETSTSAADEADAEADSTETPTTTDATAATTSAPAATTAAPTTDAPAATTVAPTATEAAENSSKCSRRPEVLAPPNPTTTMLQHIALAALVFQAAAISRAVGHGNIIVPKPTGDADHEYYFGGPAGTIDMAEIIGDASYGDYYQAVDDWFTANNVASLKEYITTYGTDISECGNTEKAGTVQAVPSDGYAQHDTLGNSHPGPCEIWCDDTRVFHDTNCVTKFSGESPAKIPIDVATCESSAEFVFYWLALHAQPWQVYINCVALDGTAAASTGSSNSTTTTTAPAATTATTTTTAPATTTATPVATSTEASTAGEAASETEAPAVTTAAPETEAPVATTAAPSTSTSKCSRLQLSLVALTAVVVIQAAYTPTVLGHGNIIVPPPTGDADHVYYFGGPAGTIDMAEIIGDASYGDYYLAVDEWFTANGITSLKEYITTYGTNISECGNTLKDGTEEPIPSNGYAEHDTLGNSHPGPCEVWCDDTRVFNNTNCVTEFSGQSPAMIPIDVATCESSSEFVFYWLALHAQPWQVYINCVALDGTAASYTSGSASTTAATTSTTTTSTAASTADEATTTDAPTSTTATTTTDAPATTTAAPTATTAAASSTTTATSTEASAADEATTATTTPTATSAVEETATDAPAATTAAPAATTATPAATTATTTTSSDKCSVRRSRNSSKR